MPEFDFYCLISEWRTLLEAIVHANEVSLVLDNWYPTSSYDVHTIIDDALLHRIANGKRRVYLVGDFTTKSMFLEQQLTGARAGFFAVNGSDDGPAIALTLPACEAASGELRLANGSLFHPTDYWDRESETSSDAPASVRAAFRGVRTTLKSSLQLEAALSDVWISREAHKALASDRAKILVNGQWISGYPESGRR